MKIHQLATATDNLLCIKYDAICREEGGAVDAICLEINGEIVAEDTFQIKERRTIGRLYLVEIKDSLNPGSLQTAMEQIKSSANRLKEKKRAIAIIIFNEECSKPYSETENVTKYIETKMTTLKIPIYIKCPEGLLKHRRPETELEARELEELEAKIKALEQITHELAY